MPVASDEHSLNEASARFRAVLMTSPSPISGVLPFALSTRAGAGGQNAIGVTVIGGMIGATMIGLFVIPSLYYAIRSMREWRGLIFYECNCLPSSLIAPINCIVTAKNAKKKPRLSFVCFAFLAVICFLPGISLCSLYADWGE